MGTWKSVMAITNESGDAEASLDSLVDKGLIASWRGGTGLPFRKKSGEHVAECLLTDLDARPSDDDKARAERFWHGAIEADGSMSTALLSVMRMDDEKRKSYLSRYKTIERYVEEMCSVHADTILLSDGAFCSNSGLRGKNQLHDWNVGFMDRFVAPLARGSNADGSPVDAVPEQASLTVRMFEYQDKSRK